MVEWWRNQSSGDKTTCSSFREIERSFASFIRFKDFGEILAIRMNALSPRMTALVFFVQGASTTVFIRLKGGSVEK